MPLHFKPYEKKYLRSCAKLVRATWKIHKELKDVENPEYVYMRYALECVIYSRHLDLIVDEHDEVKGILWGSIEGDTWYHELGKWLSEIKLGLWTAYHYFCGHFGERKTAREALNGMDTNNACGEKYADQFDSEINLFIVSPDLRGQGYGVKLMDRYMDFCREHGLETAFLWTDLGCTYSFYEKYGYKLYEKFHSEYLTDGKKNTPNGMIYYIHVNERE